VPTLYLLCMRGSPPGLPRRQSRPAGRRRRL